LTAATPRPCAAGQTVFPARTGPTPHLSRRRRGRRVVPPVGRLRRHCAGLTWLRRPASPAGSHPTQHRGHPSVARASGLTSAARMGCLLRRRRRTRVARAASTSGSVERPTPDGAAVVLSFVCNRTLAEQVAAAGNGRRPSAGDGPWRGHGGGCPVGGPE
jgi:hypothetical protein